MHEPKKLNQCKNKCLLDVELQSNSYYIRRNIDNVLEKLNPYTARDKSAKFQLNQVKLRKTIFNVVLMMLKNSNNKFWKAIKLVTSCEVLVTFYYSNWSLDVTKLQLNIANEMSH